jgi:hypothetical protein
VTPDGIRKQDWDRVHESALDVVNTSASGEEPASDAATVRLRALLDELEAQYGPLPSILGTRADYVDTLAEREHCLRAAHDLAQRRADRYNLAWVASSLAGFYLEEQVDVIEGSRWLCLLDKHLRACPEAAEQDEYARLNALAERLFRTALDDK